MEQTASPVTANPELALAAAIAAIVNLAGAAESSARAGTHPTGLAEMCALTYLRAELEALAQQPTGTVTAAGLLRAIQAAAVHGIAAVTR